MVLYLTTTHSLERFTTTLPVGFTYKYSTSTSAGNSLTCTSFETGVLAAIPFVKERYGSSTGHSSYILTAACTESAVLLVTVNFSVQSLPRKSEIDNLYHASSSAFNSISVPHT